MNIITLDLFYQYQFEVLHQLKKVTPIHFAYASFRRKADTVGDMNIINQLKVEIFDAHSITELIDEILFPKNIIEKNRTPWCIDQSLLTSLAEIELNFLKLSDRNAIFHSSVHQRRKYFYILINYFNSIIDENKIDAAILFDTPHTFYSNIFYELLLLKNIPIIKVEHHQLTEHLMIINSDLVPELPADYLPGKSKNEVWESLSDSIKDCYNKSNSFTLAYIKNDKKHIIKNNVLSHLKLEYKFYLKMAANIIRGVFPFLFEKGLLHFTAFNNINSRLWYRLAINSPVRKLVSLQSYYMNISSMVDLDVKYIYIGLHMQPEKTSQPLGRHFDHQFIPIEILAHSLPPNWKLYVKEHPNQFNVGKVSNNNYRDKYFYDAINKLDNVEWVSLEQDSQELIHKTQIVATLTGTMGWEALQLGKPVIAFGNSFYSACRAVKSPKDVPSCKEDIAFLNNLTPDEILRELFTYLKYYSDQKYLVKASNSELRFKHSSSPRADQINLITQTILHHLPNP